MSESQLIVEVVNLEVEMQMTQSSPHIKPTFRPILFCVFSFPACILLSAAYIESYKQFFIANTDVNTRTNKSVDVRMFFEVAAIPV